MDEESLEVVTAECKATTKKITLVFSRAVGDDSAEKKANYSIEFGGKPYTTFKAKRLDDHDTVELTSKSKTGFPWHEDDTLTVTVRNIFPSGEGDPMGETTVELTVVAEDEGGQEPAPLTITNCTATTTRVTVIFSEGVEKASAEVMGNYVIKDLDDVDGQPFEIDKVEVDPKNEAAVIITLKRETTSDPLTGVKKIKITVTNVKNKTGQVTIVNDGQANVCVADVNSEGVGPAPLKTKALLHSIDVKLGAWVMATIGPQAYELLVTRPLEGAQVQEFMGLVEKAEGFWREAHVELCKAVKLLTDAASEPEWFRIDATPQLNRFLSRMFGITTQKVKLTSGEIGLLVSRNLDQLYQETAKLEKLAKAEVTWLSGSFESSDMAIVDKRIKDRADEAKAQLDLLNSLLNKVENLPPDQLDTIKGYFQKVQEALTELQNLIKKEVQP
ncbi:MAG: hypothetical protein BroJett011_75420 [Chloroflexota bacterium]|nr:MAG: hypothetical protein BroJett011_75420 [Chloroflexota bacterium]